MENSKKLNYRLDFNDKEIINFLTDNTKTSLAYIAKNLGLSLTAVYQRVKKLEVTGVIDNDMSFLNPKNIGYSVVSYMGVFLNQPDYRDIIKSLKDINEVVEAHYTTGGYSIFLKVLCKDNDHLMDILNKIHKLKGVIKTETFVSLEEGIKRQLKI